MNSEELKPCPFCGEAELRIQQHPKYYYRVCCTGCSVQSAAWPTEKEAIRAWNTRPSADSELVERYKTLDNAKTKGKDRDALCGIILEQGMLLDDIMKGIAPFACTRSHPHEEMSKKCELRAEIARLKARPTPAVDNGELVARKFHEAYERLAPEFGYETREDTKQFNPESKNGKLMIAVCGEIISALTKQSDSELVRELDVALNGEEGAAKQASLCDIVAQVKQGNWKLVKAPENAMPDPDLSKCPNCGGEADNGHDRCVPPNPYYCTKCEAMPDDNGDKNERT